MPSPSDELNESTIPTNPAAIIAAGNLVGRSTYYLECVRDPVSPEAEHRDDGSQVVRTYFIAWDTRWDASRDLLGWPAVKTIGSTKYVSRSTPHLYPEALDSNNKPFLFATSMKQVDGWGIPELTGGVSNMKSVNNVARYLLAKVRVVYESLTYDVLTDAEMLTGGFATGGAPDEATIRRYVTMVPKPSGEYLTMPDGAFRYVEAGLTPVKGRPGKIVPGYDISLTWHRIPKAAVGSLLYNPTMTTPSIDNALGRVNKTAFLGQPPGTLLCMPPDIRPIRSAVGDRVFDIEYKLKQFNPRILDPNGNPVGHNHLYAPGPTPAAGYYEVTADGVTNFGAKADNKNIYDWYEFAELLRPQA